MDFEFDSITDYAIPVFDHDHEYVPAHVYNVRVCVRVRVRARQDPTTGSEVSQATTRSLEE